MSKFSKLLAKYKEGPSVSVCAPVKPEVTVHHDKGVIFEALSRIWRNRQKKQCVASTHPHEEPSCLGILVLIVDSLPHEHIWRLWLEEAGDAYQSRVRFFIHAKFPSRVSSSWVRGHLVDYTFSPAWASLELTKAMVSLLYTAYTEESPVKCSKFCFASESCIPIIPLADAIELVNLEDSKSWIKFTHKANNGYAEMGQFRALKKNIPDKCVVKSDQWTLLSRTHVADILCLPQLLVSELLAVSQTPWSSSSSSTSSSQSCSSSALRNFSLVSDPALLHAVVWAENKIFSLFPRKGGASDEMYIASCMSILGHIDCQYTEHRGLMNLESNLQDEESSVRRKRLTFAEWLPDEAQHPTSFLDITEKYVAEARKQGCIFFRKLKANKYSSTDSGVPCLVEKWINLVVDDAVKKKALLFKYASFLPTEVGGLDENENTKKRARLS